MWGVTELVQSAIKRLSKTVNAAKYTYEAYNKSKENADASKHLHILSTFLRTLPSPDFQFLTLPGFLSSVSNMWYQEEVFPLHYAFRNGHE